MRSPPLHRSIRPTLPRRSANPTQRPNPESINKQSPRPHLRALLQTIRIHDRKHSYSSRSIGLLRNPIPHRRQFRSQLMEKHSQMVAKIIQDSRNIRNQP